MTTVFTLEGAFADQEGLPEDYLLQALGGEITNGNTIVEIDR